jgi:hypothetical protein
VGAEHSIRCKTCDETLKDVDGYAIEIKGGDRWGMRDVIDSAPLFRDLEALQERCQWLLESHGYKLCGHNVDVGWLAQHADHVLQVVSDCGDVVHERGPRARP